MDENTGRGVGDMAAEFVVAGELVDIGAKADTLDNAFNPDSNLNFYPTRLK